MGTLVLSAGSSVVPCPAHVQHVRASSCRGLVAGPPFPTWEPVPDLVREDDGCLALRSAQIRCLVNVLRNSLLHTGSVDKTSLRQAAHKLAELCKQGAQGDRRAAAAVPAAQQRSDQALRSGKGLHTNHDLHARR